MENLLTVVTIIVTWVLGMVSKKVKFVNNKFIPIQNLLIGVIVAIIEFIVTKNFNTAIALSGLLAGGTYDIFHNLEKIVKKEDNNE